MNFKQVMSTFSYPLVVLSILICLYSLSNSLKPIADWSRIPKDCFKRTNAFEGLPQGLELNECGRQ